jgi:hypothetical protein
MHAAAIVEYIYYPVRHGYNGYPSQHTDSACYYCTYGEQISPSDFSAAGGDVSFLRLLLFFING